jgi:diacylglycerol kinase (ATP)
MKYQVIVNPIAGRGLGARTTPTIHRMLSEHGLDFDLVSTTYPGETIELARRAVLDGYDVVVAAGGDGTYHEAINGMIAAHDGTMPDDGLIGTIGVLPVGSGCDFSYAAGVPSSVEDACLRLARGTPKTVDLGRVIVDGDENHPGTRYFDNTMGIGFDGVVTLEARKYKRLRGMALYLPVVLKTVFISFEAPRLVIEYQEAPGKESLCRLERTVLMATICIGQREGGGFYVAPDAKNDDGLFDVLLADNLPRLQILGMLPHIMKGTHQGKRGVSMLRSRRIVITSPDPLIAHADGEMLCTDAHRIECQIAAHRVRVIG